MDSELHDFLTNWNHPMITSADLRSVLSGSPARRHSLVKRRMKKGILLPLKRGMYLVGQPYNQTAPNPFALAALLYGPSYISFESALSHYGWIPEAVTTTTSATTKRHRDYRTDVGRFVYARTPSENFLLGVRHCREEGTSYLLADPWKAVADICYCRKKVWTSLNDLVEDLRVEIDELEQSELLLLHKLRQQYASPRVRRILTIFYEELSNANSNN